MARIGGCERSPSASGLGRLLWVRPRGISSPPRRPKAGVIHRGEQWTKPEKSAKTLPPNIERRFFADTQITAYRLAARVSRRSKPTAASCRAPAAAPSRPSSPHRVPTQLTRVPSKVTSHRRPRGITTHMDPSAGVPSPLNTHKVSQPDLTQAGSSSSRTEGPRYSRNAIRARLQRLSRRNDRLGGRTCPFAGMPRLETVSWGLPDWTQSCSRQQQGEHPHPRQAGHLVVISTLRVRRPSERSRYPFPEERR